MTSELRPAVEVWREAYEESFRLDEAEGEQAAAAVIEADREAVRAEVVGEIVAWLRVQQHGRTSDNYPGYFARQIEANFGGRDAD